MNTKKTKPESEFDFIQEKVISRRKNKVKKVVLLTLLTIFLAMLFGIVARMVFAKSEGFVNRLLGIDTTKRSEIKFPSSGSDNPEITGEPDLTGTVGTEKPDLTPTQEPEVTVTPEVTPVVEHTVVKQKIPATISDYEKIMLDIRKTASVANSSLVTIVAIEKKADWMDEIYVSKKSTTGIVLGENNAELLILADYSKIKSASELQVTFSGGFSVDGKLWDYDKDYNLAIIAIKLKDITPSQMSTILTAQFGESYSLCAGTPILALGNPNGNADSMELGIVTGAGYDYYIIDNRLDLFTTDITNNENSGGVIINLRGEIVGIISPLAKVNEDSNVSTSVGISRLKSIIEKLTNRYDRILFGVTAEDIPDAVLQEYELDNGIYVTKVQQDSPAYNGDIRPGDILTEINEYKVASIINMASILNNYKDGETIDVTLYRNSKGSLKEIKTSITLLKKE